MPTDAPPAQGASPEAALRPPARDAAPDEAQAFARGNAFARALAGQPRGWRWIARLGHAAALIAVAALLVLSLITAGLLLGGLLHAAISRPIALLALLCLVVLFAAMRRPRGGRDGSA